MEEQKYQDLINQRADLTVAMILLHQNTKENRTQLSAVNAEMYTVGERLKRLHIEQGDIDYVLPDCRTVIEDSQV